MWDFTGICHLSSPLFFPAPQPPPPKKRGNAVPAPRPPPVSHPCRASACGPTHRRLLPLLGSQILFDAPNAFTEYLALGDRVINHQSSIWIDYPGVFFPVIIAYLSGIDIFHRDAELGVNMANFDAVYADAVFFQAAKAEGEAEGVG